MHTPKTPRKNQQISLKNYRLAKRPNRLVITVLQSLLNFNTLRQTQIEVLQRSLQRDNKAKKSGNARRIEDSEWSR